MPKLAKFAFNLGDRVYSPADDPVQGIVSGRKQTIGHENEYDVHFLNPDCSLSHIVCRETVLLEAQPASVKKKR